MHKKLCVQTGIFILTMILCLVMLYIANITPLKLLRFIRAIGLDIKPLYLFLSVGVATAEFKKWRLLFVLGLAVIIVALSFAFSFLIIAIYDLLFVNQDTKIHNKFIKENYAYPKTWKKCISCAANLLICALSVYLTALVPLYEIKNSMGGALLFFLLFFAFFVAGKICVAVIKKVISALYTNIKNKYAWR